MAHAVVAAGERITRFLRHSSQYSAIAKRVRHTAFLPPRASPRVSVFRTADMTEHEIWFVADRVIAPEKRIEARADLTTDHVRSIGLDIEPEPRPHPRHADIVGWPEDKPEQMDAAKTLATLATLVLRLGA